MIHFDECINLFARAIDDLNYKHIANETRKLNESDYFAAYLHFINNSIHYSRFTHSIRGIQISGKYLNQKVNKWTKAGVFEKMHEYMITNYKNTHPHTKHVYIDGHIVTNRYGTCDNVGRCTYFKSKNGCNLQSIVDDNGIGLGFNIVKGSASESKALIDTLNSSKVDDASKYEKSKKFRKYFIADAGYDAQKNREFILSKGYKPLIWANKRNTKNKKKIKAMKLNKKEMKHYKTRHIIENSYSWMETKIPRLSKIYDKKISNYMNMVYVANIDIILSKKCV
jgi:hypothetical protein